MRCEFSFRQRLLPLLSVVCQGVSSIPRNWVITVDGKVMFEGVGFSNDGEEWMKKAAQAIEKVKDGSQEQ